ncbi:MAG: hag, partial [Frankiales bacterium]|nr:hag [Frankiales bacterium]
MAGTTTRSGKRRGPVWPMGVVPGTDARQRGHFSRTGNTMSLRVNTNIAAMNAYRSLTTTEASQGKSLEKLSSGLRINRAADDAAGLVNSESLRSQVGGL